MRLGSIGQNFSLLLAFAVACLSGDEESSLHIYSGYVVLELMAFRVLWGLIGTRYARFINFMYSPGAAIQYLKGLVC